MIQIETLSELRSMWKAVMRVLKRDLGLASDLSTDPLATMKSLGYEVRGEAATALRKAVAA